MRRTGQRLREEDQQLQQFEQIHPKRTGIRKYILIAVVACILMFAYLSLNKNKNHSFDLSKIQDPGQVITIAFDEKQSSKLPLQFLIANDDQQSIQDVLYPDSQTRQQRIKFNQQRHAYLDANLGFQSLFLAKYNLILSEDMDRQAKQANKKDWQRLQDQNQISKIQTQLPMCIIVPGYNNNDKFRIQYNLNSIFSQNYSNYKAVIINDASTDQSGQIYRAYLKFYNIDPKHYVYIQNKKRVTALQNIYLNSIKHCDYDSIVVTLDADDQFIGRNVLKMFNWGYQTFKSGVLYSNFYWYDQGNTIKYGFTSQYSYDQKILNKYREVKQRFSHLRSFRNQLLHQINPKDLQDNKGQFFTIAYDMVLFFPLMQLACTRVNKLSEEYHYLYNINTGLNDYSENGGKQMQVDQQVRKQKKYQCYREFDQKMKKIQ